jgi:hypothetical protein
MFTNSYPIVIAFILLREGFALEWREVGGHVHGLAGPAIRLLQKAFRAFPTLCECARKQPAGAPLSAQDGRSRTARFMNGIPGTGRLKSTTKEATIVENMTL